MKPGPVIAMLALIAVGFWLVLQPTLAQSRRIDPLANRYTVTLGSAQLAVEQRPVDPESTERSAADFEYHFIGRADLEQLGWIPADTYQRLIRDELDAWQTRPAVERTLLGFFNISSWGNFIWVAVGLIGQAAFFGRMLVQWIVSEKSRESVVPELFWWFSFLGGVCLFTYFVWRVDIVGVLGQSTGVVIYARNLRLIQKQKRRAARGIPDPDADPKADPAPEPTGTAETGDAETGSASETTPTESRTAHASVS